MRMKNYELFWMRLSTILSYSFVCFTVLATAGSLHAKDHSPELANVNANFTQECSPNLKSCVNNYKLPIASGAVYNDSVDITNEKEFQSTTIYGIEFQFKGKWEKISDRDFPQGALLFNDGKSLDGSAFVSVIPENLLEDGPAEIMKMTPTGERTIDGRKVVIYETDVIEENIHALFLVFEDLQHKGSNIVIMAFSPAQRWSDVSGEVNSLLDNAKIR